MLLLLLLLERGNELMDYLLRLLRHSQSALSLQS